MSKAYPNHYEMKKARIQVMDRFDGNCVMCGDFAWCIHHCDGTDWNHSIDNLIAVCHRCHFRIFHKRSNSTGIIPPKEDDLEDLRRYRREYYEKYGREQYLKYRKRERASRITGIDPIKKDDTEDLKRYRHEYYKKYGHENYLKYRKRERTHRITGIDPIKKDDPEDLKRYQRECRLKYIKK